MTDQELTIIMILAYLCIGISFAKWIIKGSEERQIIKTGSHNKMPLFINIIAYTIIGLTWPAWVAMILFFATINYLFD